MGLGAVLDITHSALLASRTALDVTGHNIANADTEGYSRQRVVFGPRPPLPFGALVLGTGVDVDNVLRSYNRFATMNVDRQTSVLGSLEARSEYLTVLEAIFNETGEGGLGSRISAFWAGWQDVANNPGGTAERAALLQLSQEMVSLMHTQRESLTQVSAELKLRVTQEVAEINSLVSQVAQLNNEIVSMEAGGASANDLRDQRDLILNQLCETVDCNYFECPDGRVTVFIANRLMVDGACAYELEAQSAGDTLNIVWNGSSPGTENISSQITGGRLGGHLAMLNATVPDLTETLDDIAEALIFEVNRLHSQGVGQSASSSATTLYHTDDPAQALNSAASGLPYWEAIDDSGTAGFKIHVYDASGAALVAGGTQVTITAGMSLNQLAAAIDGVNGLSASVSNGYLTISAAAGEGGSSFAFSGDTSNALAALGINVFFSGQDASSIEVAATEATIAAAQVQADSTFGLGDGRNALNIADLEDTRVSVGGILRTFGDAVGGLQGQIGATAASVERSRSFQQAMLDQLASRRDSQTGVSIDEEMINLMRFQHAYNAAAKLLQIADEMLTTLVELKR